MSLAETKNTNNAAADSEGATAVKKRTIDNAVGALNVAIKARDADGIYGAYDLLEELQGPGAAATIAAALGGNGVAESTLALLKERAKSLGTSDTWRRLAGIAFVVGNNSLAAEAADASMEDEPNVEAGYIEIVVLNRGGEYEEALRSIEDLVDRFPSLKNDPHIIQQTALAELGLGRAEAVLTTIKRNRERQKAAGIEFDACVLTARALEMIPARTAEAIPVWEKALAVADQPAKSKAAREGLVIALVRAERFDESLSQVDEGLETARNAFERVQWLEMRARVLSGAGKIDQAQSILEELLKSAQGNRERRLELRMRQARFEVEAGRWKQAAARYDAATAEIAPEEDPTAARRYTVRFEKVRALANEAIDSVLTDLDELESYWNGIGWPATIDFRVSGLLNAGRVEEAQTWLRRRLAEVPSLADHPASFQLLGEIEMKRGESDAAMEWYAKAATVAPDTSDTRALGAIMACAYAAMRWKEAVNAYDRLIEVDPNQKLEPNVRVIAAAAQLRLGNDEGALELTKGAEPTTFMMKATRDQVRSEAFIHLDKPVQALAETEAALKRLEEAEAREVPAEFLPFFHNLRAQIYNARGNYEAAHAAASAAIEAPDASDTPIAGVSAVIRTSAYVQRSVSMFKLGALDEAHDDTDAALAEMERSRNTTIAKWMSRSAEVEDMESTLWYIKGRLLDEQKRNEEALAAYTRAERCEKTGNKAPIARGYALAATGDFVVALTSFEEALTRATTVEERGDAFVGKGHALVRLARYEEAIAALHAALDVRLLAPDNDPVVYEFLGIAYNALGRTSAAEHAFHRAWVLTPEVKRSPNLARGITAAQLTLHRPHDVLNFLDTVPARLKEDRTLLFNRALALDALGRRREAIGYLVRAKDAGLSKAQQELDCLDTPAGLGGWTHYWFGPQAGMSRRVWGALLLLITATGVMGAPVFQFLLQGKLDWYLLLIPSAVALVGLALPNLKSLGVEAGGVTLSAEPMTATGRDATHTPPEGFNVPMLSTLSISVTEIGSTSLTR